MTRVAIITHGEDIVAAELDATGDRAIDLMPIWPAIINKMERIEREQFNSRGGRGGNPWPALAESTLRRKFHDGLSMEIMQATEELVDSLTSDGGFAVREKLPEQLSFGAELKQFRVHQDYNPSSNYPERSPIDFTPQDEFDFAMVMMEYIAGLRNVAGAPVSKGRFTTGRNPLR